MRKSTGEATNKDVTRSVTATSDDWRTASWPRSQEHGMQHNHEPATLWTAVGLAEGPWPAGTDDTARTVSSSDAVVGEVGPKWAPWPWPGLGRGDSAVQPTVLVGADMVLTQSSIATEAFIFLPTQNGKP